MKEPVQAKASARAKALRDSLGIPLMHKKVLWLLDGIKAPKECREYCERALMEMGLASRQDIDTIGEAPEWVAKKVSGAAKAAELLKAKKKEGWILKHGKWLKVR